MVFLFFSCLVLHIQHPLSHLSLAPFNFVSTFSKPHIVAGLTLPRCKPALSTLLLSFCYKSTCSTLPALSSLPLLCFPWINIPFLSQFGTILYDIQKTPGSKKGYSLSARTAVRFPPCNKVRLHKEVSCYTESTSRSVLTALLYISLRVVPLGLSTYSLSLY